MEPKWRNGIYIRIKSENEIKLFTVFSRSVHKFRKTMSYTKHRSGRQATVFESEKDLSQGLSRGENQPPEPYAPVERPPIYTAYTQPAEMSDGPAYAAGRKPPAAPPPEEQGERAEKKPKKRSHAAMVVFVIVALLFIAAGLFVLRYEVNLGKTESGFYISVLPRGSSASKGMQDIPAKPGSSVTDEELQNVLTPSGGAPSGVRLEINSAEAELSFKEIYIKCSPSITSISAHTVSGNYTGTGIVMRSDGYIITNAHVIEGAYELSVTLYDGKEFPAKLIGSDTMSDLAVLKIDAKGLKAAQFGDSDALCVGDEVVAIGNPYDQSLTMTNGIVSAINRSVAYNGSTMTLIQTNAAINEGNSGGALINMSGQVIGVTNMKLVSSYSSIEGIGYAIPSATVKVIVDELLEHGYVEGRPGIGITLEEVPEAARIYYGLPAGLYVRAVQENSDAYAKGVRVGDMVIAIDDVAVTTTSKASEIKNSFSVGESLKLTIYRDGITFDVSVILMDMGLFD